MGTSSAASRTASTTAGMVMVPWSVITGMMYSIYILLSRSGTTNPTGNVSLLNCPYAVDQAIQASFHIYLLRDMLFDRGSHTDIRILSLPL
jgi:hypothetical protein